MKRTPLKRKTPLKAKPFRQKKGKSQKEKTWDACSRFIRLRDALAYCRERGIDLAQFTRTEDIVGKCCTCSAVKSWIRMDAGHCIGRGIGGGSGVYFNEKNLALQCKQCNAWRQGARPEFEEHLISKRGPDIMDELKRLDKINRYTEMDLIVLEIYFKEEYRKLESEA